MRVAHLMLRLVFVAVTFLLIAGASQATYVFPFKIFTQDGDYSNSPAINMYAEVSNGEAEIVDFTFYNISTVNSSLARIYFDDGSLLNIATLTNGPGTLFSENEFPGPGNLPSGETIGFYADREFTIGALAPPPENGVNPVDAPPLEWVKIRFNLRSGANLEDVISELQSGALRVGIHIISLPDGSSESAIMIPEPATLSLLAVGAAALLRRRKS